MLARLIIAVLCTFVFISLCKPAYATETVCDASWYGPGFYGNLTASGEVFVGEADYTAASPYLPFGTVVYVENLWTGYGAYFRINDRGPYVYGRCIDLSQPWLVDYGVAPVYIEVVY